jgi:MoaA/NifB/PqqE/SkfB family radical SAM enzyme
MGMIIPRVLTFFVTNRCNALCSHCFNWKADSTGELTLEEIEKIDFSFFDSVSVTGGEPTLRDDIAEVCKHVSCKNKLTLSTNGTLTKRAESVISAVGSNKINFNISLDGVPAVHDSIRGIKCFDAAVSTIRLCRKMGVDVTIVSTVSRYNMDKIPEMMRYLTDEGIVTKKGDVVFNITRGLNHLFNVEPSVTYYHNPRDDTTMLSLDELKTTFANIKTFMTNQNKVVWEYSIKMLSSHKKLFPCFAGTREMILHSNGEVSACEYTKPFANVRNFDYDLIKLWNNKDVDDVRNRLKDCYCIHPCNLNTAIPRTLTGIVKLFPDIVENKSKKLRRQN